MANEKRLIDANAFIKECDSFIVNPPFAHPATPWHRGLTLAAETALRMPTVDAVEVVHGYWIDSTSVDHLGRVVEHSIDCSACECVFKDDSRAVVKRWKERFEWCPFCGAKMDAKE